MVDTIRTIGELNALLADNSTGDIAAQDIRDLAISQNVHTEIGRGSLSTNIGVTYTKIPMTLAGNFERGFTADIANDQISNTPVTLKALISVELQIPILQNNRIVDFAVFVSGVESTRLTRTFVSIGHYTWNAGVQLAQNDTIDLRVKADQESTSIDINLVLLRAQRIGIE